MSARRLRPAALILAAGYSSRMGRFKPLLPVGGDTALARLAGALRAGGVERIVVVSGHDRARLLPALQALGLEEAYNPAYAEGMFTSVAAGFRHLFGGGETPDGVLLCPVDVPLVSTAVIARLLREAAAAPERLFVPVFQGKKGHPLWLPAALHREILSYGGGEGLKGVLRPYEEELVRLACDEEGVVLDMDTPEAYEQLLQYDSAPPPPGLSSLAAGRRWLLIRHGQIQPHADKIFLGQYDPPLSETGRREMSDCGRRLAKLGLCTDTIYGSDLQRAAEGARLIAAEARLERVELTRSLREMALGAWDGQLIRDVQKRWPQQYEARGKRLLTYKFDTDSENFYDLQYRVVRYARRLLQRDHRPDLVIVTHAGAIRALYGNLLGEDVAWGLAHCHPAPGELTTVSL